mgnify:CR=1 FL=1
MEDAVTSVIGYPVTDALEIIGLLVGAFVLCVVLGYICLVVDWIRAHPQG